MTEIIITFLSQLWQGIQIAVVALLFCMIPLVPVILAGRMGEYLFSNRASKDRSREIEGRNRA
jgi:hypothetical protein